MKPASHTFLSVIFLCAALLHLSGAETARLFDGTSLNGWSGDPRFWRVEDGAITGETTADQGLKKNTFLIWKGGTVDDFTIEFSYRIVSEEGNSGLQYRSLDRGDFQVTGYQANVEQGGKNRNAMIYSEGTGREVLALAGERTRVGDGKTRLATERIAETKDLFAQVKGRGEWNRYQVVAQGTTTTISINGRLMSQTTDESAQDAATRGILAFQLHVGKAMKIQFRDILLTRLAPQ